VLKNHENQFSQFRTQLYHEHFNNRNDTLMDLVDALASNTQARSVVELSLSPLFPRGYSSIYKGITDYKPQKAKKNLAELAGPYLPPRWKGKFWLFGTDTTPCPRPYAFKLSERECVYQPTPIKGQIPITYGHEYSEVGLLPERKGRHSPPWIVPQDAQRTSRKNREQIAISQMRTLLENRNLPFSRELCLQVGDSHYSTPSYLAAFSDKPNLVTITRSRGNRGYYFPAPVTARTAKRGHPAWYGKKMKLKDPLTWPQPDEEITIPKINRKGKTQWVKIQAWQNVLMRGKCKPAQIPMHCYPFTLVRICIYNDRDELVYRDPLWLIVMGHERQQLSLQDIYEAFQERSAMEHFFRFTKQKLLLDSFQTPETAHEEHWWQIANLAYLQLWVAKEHASCLPRPWERSLPQVKEKHLSPTMVQRSFTGIIRQFGTPAGLPKRRGYSPGRRQGTAPALRIDRSIILQLRN
jgi:hypothetical protein